MALEEAASCPLFQIADDLGLILLGLELSDVLLKTDNLVQLVSFSAVYIACKACIQIHYHWGCISTCLLAQL